MSPGDKVMCLKTFKCIQTDRVEFTAGKIYIVKQVIGDTVYIEKDDNGETDNGLARHNFQLVQ